MARSVAGAVRARWGGPATVSRSGVQRANRFMLLVLTLQRVSYLLPAATTVGSHAYRNPAANSLLICATAGWNGTLIVLASRRGWFTRWNCAGGSGSPPA